MSLTQITQMPLRIPLSLHEDLKLTADSQGISLNQYCLYLLAKNVPPLSVRLSQKAGALLNFLQEAQLMQAELEKHRPKARVKRLPDEPIQTPLARKWELYGKI